MPSVQSKSFLLFRIYFFILLMAIMPTFALSFEYLSSLFLLVSSFQHTNMLNSIILKGKHLEPKFVSLEPQLYIIFSLQKMYLSNIVWWLTLGINLNHIAMQSSIQSTTTYWVSAAYQLWSAVWGISASRTDMVLGLTGPDIREGDMVFYETGSTCLLNAYLYVHIFLHHTVYHLY